MKNWFGYKIDSTLLHYKFFFHQPYFTCLFGLYFSLECGSMTISLLCFSISFTVIPRHCQLFFKYPQGFSRGTHGRFPHNVPTLNDDDKDVSTAFLYMTAAEFLAINGLAQEVFAWSDTETISFDPPNELFWSSYDPRTQIGDLNWEFCFYHLLVFSHWDFFSDTSVSILFLFVFPLWCPCHWER